MNRMTIATASILASLALGAMTSAAVAAPHDQDKVLDFDTMVGVARPFTGPANPIRGVPGGGLPWVLDRITGVLRADGRLEIHVRGLVLADDPSVPADRRLTNPVANFRATVSCVSTDGTGAPTNVNVSTDNFPATPQGNAFIRATLDLPTPCIAPIVFVTNPNGAWFAATGR